MTTWNPGDKSGTVTLTNGNLTATSASAVSQSVRSSTSKTSGKAYWEITIGTRTNDLAFGIGNSTLALNISSGIGGDANAAGFYSVSPPQALYVAGAQLYQGTTASANGDIVKFAVDFGTSPPTAWILDAAMTGWNNSGTANPSTGTGGQALTGLAAGPYFAVFNDDLGGASATANFGASAFSGTVPTGFSAWDPPAAPTLTAMQLSIIT